MSRDASVDDSKTALLQSRLEHEASLHSAKQDADSHTRELLDKQQTLLSSIAAKDAQYVPSSHVFKNHLKPRTSTRVTSVKWKG